MTDLPDRHPTAGRYPHELEETHMTAPAPSVGVEWKVKAATAASYIGGVVGLALLQALSDPSLWTLVPPPYSTLLAPIVPAVVTFLAGYITKHSPRSSGLGDDVDALVAQKVAEEIAKVRADMLGELGQSSGGALL